MDFGLSVSMVRALMGDHLLSHPHYLHPIKKEAHYRKKHIGNPLVIRPYSLPPPPSWQDVQTHVSNIVQGTTSHMAPEILMEGKQSRAADVSENKGEGRDREAASVHHCCLRKGRGEILKGCVFSLSDSNDEYIAYAGLRIWRHAMGAVHSGQGIPR